MATSEENLKILHDKKADELTWAEMEVLGLNKELADQRRVIEQIANERIAWQRAAEQAQSHVNVLIRALEKFL